MKVELTEEVLAALEYMGAGDIGTDAYKDARATVVGGLRAAIFIAELEAKYAPYPNQGSGNNSQTAH